MSASIVSASMVLIFGCSTLQVKSDLHDIAGDYESDNGSTLQITEGESANEYRVNAEDVGKYFWTSVGFFNPECQCVESVFQYDSHKSVYGNTIGIHRFTFSDNNSKVVKQGGWKDLSEFAKQIYTRQ